MYFQNGFSITIFLLAAMMAVTGYWQLKWPPKYRNNLKFFSKSKRAARSSNHWNYYLQYGGKLYLKLAVFFLVIGTIGLFINFKPIFGIMISVVIIAIGILIVVVKIENALIDKFGD